MQDLYFYDNTVFSYSHNTNCCSHNINSYLKILNKQRYITLNSLVMDGYIYCKYID